MTLLYCECFNTENVYQHLMEQTLEAILSIAMIDLTSASTFHSALYRLFKHNFTRSSDT